MLTPKQPPRFECYKRHCSSVEKTLPVISVCLRVAGWSCGSRFTRRRWFMTARKRLWSRRTHASSRTATDRRNFVSPSEKLSTGSWRSAETTESAKRSSQSVRRVGSNVGDVSFSCGAPVQASDGGPRYTAQRQHSPFAVSLRIWRHHLQLNK